jgi:hypothetical protein
VTSVAFSPDDARILTGSGDSTAKVWDARTGTPQLELKGHTGAVTSVAFSPDGARVVTGSLDQTARVWDARTGTPLLELKGHPSWVTSVAFSLDGTRVATGSDDKTARVWDARSGTHQLELKGHTGGVTSAAFSPDGARILTGSADQTARLWDARTGSPQLELKGHKIWASGAPFIAAFSLDGTRIVTQGGDGAKVWDARTGQELKGETIPQIIPNNRISPDGRFFAHSVGSLVELVPLQPDEEELAYRRAHTRQDLGHLKAQAAADREIAAGRTADALPYLVTVSAARPDDTILALQVAGLQAWFGQDKELADTCGRALESARGIVDPGELFDLAWICCLRPSPDTSRREAALALARKAEEHAKGHYYVKLPLGMAEYRSGNFVEADAALLAAVKYSRLRPPLPGTANFYRAMSLFRQGKENEARKLATDAAAGMKPLPKDEQNPLADGATPDDLLLWLAYREARALIGFDAAPTAPTREKK